MLTPSATARVLMTVTSQGSCGQAYPAIEAAAVSAAPTIHLRCPAT
jgi:hypothetical protein